MMLEIKPRDKKLLIVVAVLGAFFLYMYFFFFPMVTNIKAARVETQKVEAQQEKMKKKIANLSLDESELRTERQQVKEAAANMYDLLDNSQIDRMITNMVLAQKLTVQSLDIEVQPTYKMPTPYKPKDEDESTAAAAAETESQPKKYTIAVTRVKASVTGDQSNFMKLLQKIFRECPGILVVDYQTSTDTVFSVEQNYVDRSQMTITMDVYMIDKSEL